MTSKVAFFAIVAIVVAFTVIATIQAMLRGSARVKEGVNQELVLTPTPPPTRAPRVTPRRTQRPTVPTPAPTPIPVPATTETRTLAAHLEVEGSGMALAGTTLTLAHHLGAVDARVIVRQTDLDGHIVFHYPADWTTASLRVTHPRVNDPGRDITLPTNEPVEIAVFLAITNEEIISMAKAQEEAEKALKKAANQDGQTSKTTVTPTPTPAISTLAPTPTPTPIPVLKGVVTGTVVSAEDNKPIADAQLEWTPKGAEKPSETTTTDAKGEYVLEVESTDTDATLTASAKSYGSSTQTKLAPGTGSRPKEVKINLQKLHWFEALVTDSKDAPISGAAVEAFTSGASPTPLPDHEQPLKTNAEGVVRLENIAATQIVIRVTSADLAPSGDKILIADQRHIVSLSSLPNITLGQALDLDAGEPIKTFTAKYKISGSDSDEKTKSFNDPKGYFMLTDLTIGKKYDVTVEASGFESATLNISPESRDTAIRLGYRLFKADRVRGKLIDAGTEKPLEGIRVVYAIYTDTAAFNWSNLTETNEHLTSVQSLTTGKDGLFLFEKSDPPGTLFLQAEGYPSRLIHAAEIDKLPRDSNGLPLVSLDRAASISGVYTMGGSAIPNASLLLTRSDKPQKGDCLLHKFVTNSGNVKIVEGNLTTDDQGTFAIGDITPGFYQITARDKAGGLLLLLGKQIELKRGEKKVVNLGADLGSFDISGVVRTRDGLPAATVHVSLSPLFDWDYADFGAISDTQGGYRVRNLRAGSYRVTFMRTDPATNVLVDVFETVEVKNNITRDFIFEKGHLVTALLDIPSASSATAQAMFARAELTPAVSGGKPTVCLTSAGRLAFKGEFKGEYSITLTDKNGANPVTIDRVFTLDNTEADQDLGSIPAPLGGKIKLLVAFNPEDWPPAPIKINAIFTPKAPGAQPIAFTCKSETSDLDNPNPILGPLPSGVYTLTLRAQGYMDASRSVQVSPGAMFEIGFVLNLVD